MLLFFCGFFQCFVVVLACFVVHHTGLGYYSKKVQQWMQARASRTLDSQFEFNINGHGYKVICSTYGLCIWQALWIANDYEKEAVDNLSPNENISKNIYIPTVLLCALFVIHYRLRRMWSIIFKSKVTLQELDYMQENAESAATIVYRILPSFVCLHFLYYFIIDT